MKNYSKEDFTFGYEIEWGDIDRSIEIPENWGKWEYCETDIVNVCGPYRGLAVDPFGINPPVGGEINVMPTDTTDELVDRIMNIKGLFTWGQCPPSSACVNHGHVHIHVPGLKDDIEGLKHMMKYIKVWQGICNDLYGTHNLDQNDREAIKKDGLTNYLLYDGGRLMPDWMIDNIVEKAENFDDFIRIHACGKDGVSRGRPFRHAINTYNMKHTKTIEFRCFRSSTNEEEIRNSIEFAANFIEAALTDHRDPREFLVFPFPPFDYDSEMASAWKATKRESNPKLKVREYHEVINDK